VTSTVTGYGPTSRCSTRSAAISTRIRAWAAADPANRTGPRCRGRRGNWPTRSTPNRRGPGKAGCTGGGGRNGDWRGSLDGASLAAEPSPKRRGNCGGPHGLPILVGGGRGRISCWCRRSMACRCGTGRRRERAAVQDALIEPGSRGDPEGACGCGDGGRRIQFRDNGPPHGVGRRCSESTIPSCSPRGGVARRVGGRGFGRLGGWGSSARPRGCEWLDRECELARAATRRSRGGSGWSCVGESGREPSKRRSKSRRGRPHGCRWTTPIHAFWKRIRLRVGLS